MEDSLELRNILDRAAQLAGAERTAYLDAACRDNPQLRVEVESLLAALDTADQFLENPTVKSGAGSTGGAFPQTRTPAQAPADPLDGVEERIGPYRLIKKLGEGGMGLVYLAEQSQPVRREVALKIIKPGMDSASVIARFEAERQALALMDHSNIARVYDAGTTPRGRPYFVMELVRGVPITRYCDEQRLTPQERLELFIPVCQAVQHAHQKGIIHRDLKPGNVLVAVQDGKPVAKVIDFGIAKAINQNVVERSAFTQLGMMVGTPEYMSPEQAGGDPAQTDTRSDIYALGVILYELLTGATPLDREKIRAAGYDQIMQTIREAEPPRPSTRLSSMGENLASASALRRMQPRRLARFLAGDLDSIVMKCLEKERHRRYETVSALAADIHHYLAGEPVTAVPPGLGYRLGKVVKKNKLAISVISLFILALLTGTVGTSVGFFREAAQRKIAEAQKAEALHQQHIAQSQAAIAQAVSDFQVKMLEAADPFHALGDKVTVAQAVTAAGDNLDKGQLKDHPDVEAAVRSAVGQTLRSLGQDIPAEHHLRRALELRRQLSVSNPDPEVAHAAADLGLLLDTLQELDEAHSLLEESLTIEKQLLKPDDSELALAMGNLGLVLQDQGDEAGAEKLFRQAVAIDDTPKLHDDPERAEAINNLASLLQSQNKLAEALPMFQEALRINQAAFPPNHPRIAAALQNLGTILIYQFKPADAEPYYRQALQIERQMLPHEHPDLAHGIDNLALSLQRQNAPAKLDEALTLCNEALQIWRVIRPPGDEQIAKSLINLGRVYLKQLKYAQAQTSFEEALAIDNHLPTTPSIEKDRATELEALGRIYTILYPDRLAEAIADLSKALEIRDRLLGPKIIATRGTAQWLAVALKQANRADEAANLQKKYNLATTLPAMR